VDTRIDEIEDRPDRISTFVPEIAAPAGFTCNQFLLDAGEPLLVHSGMRHLFPAVSAAITTPRPATTPTGMPTWARIGHDRTYRVNVTILEHVHSRQFCMTDAHLPERAYAIQIGRSVRFARAEDQSHNVSRSSRSPSSRSPNTRVIRVAPVFSRHALGWC